MVDDRAWPAAPVEESRARPRAVGYRMLGEPSEADDVGSVDRRAQPGGDRRRLVRRGRVAVLGADPHGEETARHAGHMDIVRELIDGMAGDHRRA
jgi:hypothetical protein